MPRASSGPLHDAVVADGEPVSCAGGLIDSQAIAARPHGSMAPGQLSMASTEWASSSTVKGFRRADTCGSARSSGGMRSRE